MKLVKETLRTEKTQVLLAIPWLTQHLGTCLSFSLWVATLTPEGHAYSSAWSSSWTKKRTWHSGSVPWRTMRAVPLTSLLLQAREQRAVPGTGVILWRRSADTQMKFDHIRCWFKSCFGPADALLNLAKSFAGEFGGESPLLTTRQHQLLLAFLCGNKCHEKEGKRIHFCIFYGELKALKAMGLSHCTI